MAGHIVQHLAECEARLVVRLPDVEGYRFSLVRVATVKSTKVAAGAAEWCFR